MASCTETEINLKTLQRVDSNIIEIIDNASQVALYKYESKLEKWEGTDVEGTLFLYRRSVPPHYGLIIVNRINTTNFIESITGDMQFELQEPYLLYKNHSGEIIGSWFYEEKDLKRITKKIQTIILQQNGGGHTRMRCASDSDTKGVATPPNIITLLSHAQNEYMKTISQNQNQKSNDVDFNNLGAYFEKKPLEKSVEAFSKRTKVATTRSASQEDYTTSPRRRYKSTGSFDAERIKEISSEPWLNRRIMEDSGREVNKVGDFSGCLFARGEWVAPTRLSPLFSQDEISSPASDVISKDTTLDPHYTDPFFPYCKNNLSSSCQSSAALDWKAYLGTDCDTHFSNMKQVLKSHIQDNPPVMLKIHEAYVSSLRSFFTKS